MARARFGLDLGRLGVKLVRCENGSARGAERSIDPSLDGKARHAALVEALQEVAKELGAGPRDELNVAVPRASAIVKRLSLPNVPPSELEQMIRFQALKDLPFKLEEVVLTWGELGKTPEGGLELLFAAVRQQTLDDVRRVVTEAGFRHGNEEVSTQAAARTLALLGPQDLEEVLLVEVGHGTSDVIVLEQGRLVFSRSASVGCGSEGSDTAWLPRLCQEVNRSIVAARTRAGGDPDRTGPPDALLLAGGGANLPALHAALEQQVGRKPTILSGVDGLEPGQGARFVVARGLADPGEAPGVPELDLAHRTREAAARSSRRKVFVTSGAAAALLIVLIALVTAVLDSRQRRVSDLESARASMSADVRQARRLEAELERAIAWDRRKGRELEVLLAVSRALPDALDDSSGGAAYLTQLRWVEKRPLRLVGRAKDWDSVGLFLSNLEREPLIESATFESIKRPKGRNEKGVEFSGHAVLVGGTE